MVGFAKLLAVAFQQLKKDDKDSGKRIPLKSPEIFDGSFSKFRRWWESINEYFAIHEKRVPNDQTKIDSQGTCLRDQAADWYAERKRSMKALHLDDNCVAFSAAIEDQYTDRQEIEKDHKMLLALEYGRDMQTYLDRFNELNSRVQLSGQSLTRVLMAAITPDMYRNIWRKYGKIPGTDGDLLHAVQEAVIEEEELSQALVAKKLIARPQKEKEKEATPKECRSNRPYRPRKRKGPPQYALEDWGPTRTTNSRSKKSYGNLLRQP